ncbi:TPA: DNA-directed RNA polymerase [Kluyvera ascorbata]
MFYGKKYTELDFTEYYQGMINLFGEEAATEELDLELEAYNLGSQRYLKRLESSIEREEVNNDASLKPVVQSLIPVISDHIKAWLINEEEKPRRKCAQYQIIKNLDPDMVAFIGIKISLNKLIKNEMVTCQHIASHIGRALEEEVRFNRLRLHENDFKKRVVGGAQLRVGQSYKRQYLASTEQHIIEQSNGDVSRWERWSNQGAISLGMRVVDFIISSCHLLEREVVNVKGKSHAELKLHPSWKKKIVGRAFSLSELSPMYQPMVIPPKPWTDMNSGGYYTKGRAPLSFIRINNQEAKARYDDVDLTMIYRAINVAQDTPWKINQKVLNVIETIYQWESPVGGIPSIHEFELPPRIPGMDEDSEVGKKLLNKWKKECIPFYRKEKARVSKRLSCEFMIGQAKKFRNHKAIYFPCNLDFRGRLYAVPFFNPQGNDLTKGLLTFSNGKPIGQLGFYWLKIHGANTAGIDKVSFEDRIKWIEDNETMILSCANDPINNLAWAETDSPFMFLAFCFEYLEVKINGLEYCSSLPISFDGSNSGTQHFSAMLRDELGAKTVNLSCSSIPQDIYQIISDDIEIKLKHDLINGTENRKELRNENDGTVFEIIKHGTKSLAKQWLDYGMNRKVTKRPVMTVVYSATQYGFSDQLLEDCVRPAIDDGSGYMFTEARQACQYMAALIWEACHETISAAMKVMEWLKASAKLLAKEIKVDGVITKKAAPVHWVCPDGFPVWQNYYKQRKTSILTLINGKESRAKVSDDDTSSYNPTKQANGVAPNFVHSMDGCHLRKTVLKANTKYNITAFSLIHDSFGTVAADAENLYHSIREAFVEMYEENDVIKDFYYQFENQLPVELLSKMPPLPEKGNFNIKEVLKSKYCFA